MLNALVVGNALYYINNNMEINEVNKKLYEDAFIPNGEYSVDNNWKPSINENEIEAWSETDDGKWIPATPLGYRDYEQSRIEGLANIFRQSSDVNLTYDEAHEISKSDNKIKQYDKISIDGVGYVVSGDNEEKYYIVDQNNHTYCVDYS